MSKSIVTTLPPDAEDNTYGAWISYEDKKDVHILIERGNIVIGHNGPCSYSKDAFTDICLAVKDNKIHLQYADENNKVKMVDLTVKEVSSRIMQMLEDLKQLAESK